jgi:E-phenylitaconyl-CoA hydratase
MEASDVQMHDPDDEASARRGNYLRLMMLHRLNLWKPIVAAIDGYCFGGGLELALQADVRVASTNSSFAMTEAKVGSFPGTGGVPLLLRALPRAVAMKLLLTGDAIDAAEAHRLGLLSDVVAPAELIAMAMAIAARIAQCAPLSVEAIKRVALESEGLSHADAVDLSEKYFGTLMHTHDRAEGRRAFAEKRPPRFEGR